MEGNNDHHEPRRRYEVGYQPLYYARYQPEGRAHRAARRVIPGLIRGLITGADDQLSMPGEVGLIELLFPEPPI